MPFAFAISELHCLGAGQGLGLAKGRGRVWSIARLSWRDNHFGKLLMNEVDALRSGVI